MNLGTGVRRRWLSRALMFTLAVTVPAWVGAQGNGYHDNHVDGDSHWSHNGHDDHGDHDGHDDHDDHNNGNNGNGNGSGMQGQIAALLTQLAQALAKIGQLQTTLDAEITQRKAADVALQAALDAEIAARQAADTAETSARRAEDARLEGLIAEEIAARQAADAVLTAAAVPQELLDLANYLEISSETLNGVVGPHIIFTGANVHIRSGSGWTDDNTNAGPPGYGALLGGPCPSEPATCGTLTGLGNLIVGYNEANETLVGPRLRTGSHNLIVGPLHQYTTVGSLVDGFSNKVDGGGAYASVTGGYNNNATEFAASVSGGTDNHATGKAASVSGGASNWATAFGASVSGGGSGRATGEFSTISGGNGGNVASGTGSTVSGGEANTASGDGATVSGGFGNSATTSNALSP